MSLNPDIRDRAYQFFIEEAKELLQVLEAGLLDLRQDHSTARVHELMRAAHSIKSGAASVELQAIQEIAHRLEDFFKALYGDSVEIDAELNSLLLQGYDCLCNPLIQQIETGVYDAEAALLAAEPIFAALERRLGDALKNTESYIPSAKDLGVDVVASIFEVDVSQVLNHLTEVLTSADYYNLETEFRSQLEVLAGFAELFDLSGFAAIIQTAQTALDNHPYRAKEIMQLTIANCSAAREAVLKGDRDRGGEVAPELLSLAEENAAPIFSPASPNEPPSENKTEAEELNEVFSIPEEAMETTETAAEVSSIEDIFEDNFSPEDNHDAAIAKLPEELSPPAALESAIESIDKIYEGLPAVNNNSDWLQPPGDNQPVRPQKPKTRTSAAANLSVRVSLDRLEKMNQLVGELTIQRNSLALQNQQLQTSLSELVKKFRRCQKATGKLGEVSERMMFENWRDRAEELMEPVSNSEGVEFDALEMDRYSQSHSLTRKIIEEIVLLEEHLDDVVTVSRQNDRTIDAQNRVLRRMRDELMWARMLPLSEILQRFPRILHDLASQHHKLVELKLTGTNILVDKAVLEKLYDPLLHLLRNAFDHGIEPPEIRRQQGKPATGTIEIHAYYLGDRTIIEIKDDGRGLDLEKVLDRGIEAGAISGEQAKNTSREEILDLIFTPGLSTASEVDELSGRGMGLNVVRSQIEILKGTIAIDSIPERGTTFSLRLPLTLTIAKLLICSLGSTAFAISSDSIVDIIIPDAHQIEIADERRFLSWQRSLVPILSLAEMLPYNCPISPKGLSGKVFETIAIPKDWALPLLLVEREGKFYALEVASLISELELAIEPFNAAIAAPRYIYGCSILSDGTLIPVFDGQILIDVLLGKPARALRYGDRVTKPPSTASEFQASLEENGDNEPIMRSPKIMIVDDSVESRRQLAASLSKRGYLAIQCSDSTHALEEFRQQPDIDLIICDLAQPTNDSWEFLGMRRRDSQLARVPIIMLADSGDEHRHLAMQLGANRYFTKPYRELELLGAIDGCLQVRSHAVKSNPAALTNNSSQPTILIVDDSASLRRTMALSLKNNGYEILQARDGREGLAIITNRPQIDLVICDIEMPNMNGFEFLTERRQNAHFSKIPVAMLTSRNGDKHRRLAERLGANAYFSKPYVEKVFLTEIAKLIEHYG